MNQSVSAPLADRRCMSSLGLSDRNRHHQSLHSRSQSSYNIPSYCPQYATEARSNSLHSKQISALAHFDFSIETKVTIPTRSDRIPLNAETTRKKTLDAQRNKNGRFVNPQGKSRFLHRRFSSSSSVQQMEPIPQGLLMTTTPSEPVRYTRSSNSLQNYKAPDEPLTRLPRAVSTHDICPQPDPTSRDMPLRYHRSVKSLSPNLDSGRSFSFTSSQGLDLSVVPPSRASSKELAHVASPVTSLQTKNHSHERLQKQSSSVSMNTCFSRQQQPSQHRRASSSCKLTGQRSNVSGSFYVQELRRRSAATWCDIPASVWGVPVGIVEKQNEGSSDTADYPFYSSINPPTENSTKKSLIARSASFTHVRKKSMSLVKSPVEPEKRTMDIRHSHLRPRLLSKEVEDELVEDPHHNKVPELPKYEDASFYDFTYYNTQQPLSRSSSGVGLSLLSNIKSREWASGANRTLSTSSTSSNSSDSSTSSSMSNASAQTTATTFSTTTAPTLTKSPSLASIGTLNEELITHKLKLFIVNPDLPAENEN